MFCHVHATSLCPDPGACELAEYRRRFYARPPAERERRAWESLSPFVRRALTGELPPKVTA